MDCIAADRGAGKTIGSSSNKDAGRTANVVAPVLVTLMTRVVLLEILPLPVQIRLFTVTAAIW
jgi:hypothetical protein